MFKKASKYGNKKVVIEGIKFDSLREAEYYLQYKMLEKFGKIRDLKLQEKFQFIINGQPVLIRSEGYPNGRSTSYSADFSFWDIEKNCRRVIDVKGVQTDMFKLKRALVEAIYGIYVEIVK